MSNNDKTYFSQRALEERERAETAPSPIIAEVHLSLAMKYEALAAQCDEIAELNDRPVTSVPQRGNQVSSEGSGPDPLQ